MKKALMINCGNALILGDMPELFEGYDTGAINCGNLRITPGMQRILAEHGFSINAGTVKTVDITGEPADLGSAALLDGSTSYSGKFLVAEHSLVVTEEGAKRLEGVAGVLVAGTLYCPKSFDTGLLGKVYADEEIRYPDGSLISLDELTLDLPAVERMEPGRQYSVFNKVTALDKGSLELLREKGIRLECDALVTYASFASGYREVLSSRESTLIPDGFEIAGDDVLTPMTKALYGDRVYFPGDMRLSRADMGCIGELTAIVAEGTAYLPIEAVPAFKRIGKAGKLFAFEGELVDIGGNGEIGHEYLQAVMGAGSALTLRVNGMLTIADDVTAEDLSCIKAVYYNGTIKVKNSLRPLLERVVKSGNGAIIEPKYESLADLPGMRDVEPEDITAINVGTYKLI